MIGRKEPFGLGSVTVLVGYITSDKCNLCINLIILLARLVTSLQPAAFVGVPNGVRTSLQINN